MKMKFNRQKADYLLSDLLPYEKGNHFTNKYLYEYVLKNKQEVNTTIKNIKLHDGQFDAKWHSAPLKYKIKKKDDKFREISIINPLGSIEALIFLDSFEQDLINIIHNKKSYSIRKPNKINSLSYKKDKNQTVYYSNDNEKKQLLMGLESSGVYFKHKPYKRITDFYNSSLFTYSQDKYTRLLAIDIQDCFSSIYTHSFKWLISKKTYDSKSLSGSNSVYRGIDILLQNLNGSKTNGILIGPEMMRFLAEFLLVHIDQQIMEVISSKGIISEKDYRIYRFVDDYFIFTSNLEVEKVIVNITAEILNNFHLKINESKYKWYDNSYSINKWKYLTESFVPHIEEILDQEEKSLSNDISNEDTINDESIIDLLKSIEKKLRSKKSKIKYVDLRNRYLILLENSEEVTLVTSYIMSVILKRLEILQIDNLKLRMQENDLILFVFLLYSKDVNYTSTQKVIRILTLLNDKYQIDIKEYVERCYDRFGDVIFNNFKNDWIDLLLFNAVYNIEIAEKKIDTLIDEILCEGNPLLVAAICLYFEKKSKSRKINLRVNKLLEEKISQINWGNLFQDDRVWWIFIFYSYPKISLGNKDYLKTKLLEKKRELKDKENKESQKENKKAVYMAQQLVINFVLSENKHFIEWDFVKENYYKEYYFYTRDRTVFNPDIISQIHISK